jgi:hypothetical protein
LTQETFITNVGQNDKSSVASEATLIELIAAVEKLAKSSGGKADSSAKVLKAFNDSIADVTIESDKYVRSLTEKNKATEEENRLSSLKSRGLGLATTMLGGLAGAGTNFVKALASGDSSLTSFAQTVPVVGSYLGILTGLIDDTISSFRQLSGSGVSFGEGIFEFRRMAAEAGLSLETFTNTVVSNTQNLALLSGNINQGVRQFSAVSKIISKDFRPSLMNLGYNMDEIAQFTGDYLVQQAKLGRVQNRDAGQLAKGTNNYLLQLDKLARITGKTREEASRQLAEQLQDTRIAALVKSMGARGEELNTYLATLPDNLREGVAELLSTGGAPLTTAMKGFVNQFPDISAAAASYKKGAITTEQFNDVLRKTAFSANEYVTANGYNIALVAAIGNEYYDMMVAMSNFTGYFGNNEQAFKDQQDALKKEADALLSFDAALQNIRSNFFLAVEPLLPGIVKGFNDLFTYLGKTDILNKFIDAIGRVVDFLVGTEVVSRDRQETYRTGGLLGGETTISEILGDALINLFTNPTVIGGMLTGIALLWGAPMVVKALANSLLNLGGRSQAGSAGGGRRGRMGGRLLGAAAIGYSLFDTYNTETNPDLTRDEKNAQHVGTVGGVGGGLAGAKAGAALGVLLGPLGALAGGLLGGAAGYALGNFAGEKVGTSIFGPDENNLPQQQQPTASSAEIVNAQESELSKLNTHILSLDKTMQEVLKTQKLLVLIAEQDLQIQRDIEKNTESGLDLSKGGMLRFNNKF